MSASVSSRDLGDQRLHPHRCSSQWHQQKPYAQDRLRFSEALGLGDNSHGIGRPCCRRPVPGLIRTAVNTSEHTKTTMDGGRNGGQNHSLAKRIGGETKIN